MKRNILRAAVAASILGVSGVAFADDAEIPFQGTIQELCTLTAGSITQGTIALADTLGQTDRLTARPNETSNGTLGNFAYTCRAGNANLTVNAPVGTNPTAQALEAVPGYIEGANIYSDAAGATSIAATDTTATANAQPSGTYYVSMWAETTGTDILGGTYNYTVTVNIVDN